MSVDPQQLILISFSVALLPAVLGVMTTYLKFSIVIGMLKSALGTQHTPGAMVVMTLSATLTFMVMEPVFTESFSGFREKFLSKKIVMTAEGLNQVTVALAPWKAFLQKHSGERETLLVKDLCKETSSDSWRVAVTAFLLTELKEAFAMSLMVLIPFAVIDLIVANILGGLGMFMVSPTLLSLPLKLLIFVSSDAWIFLTRALVSPYSGG